jgi:hypothetical protein
MTTQIGIWIDHAHARIVTLQNGEALPVTTVNSNVEGHHKASGGAGVQPPAHLHGVATRSRERHRIGELVRYYRDVAKQLSSAGALFILGPGEAPRELLDAITRHHAPLAARVAGVERADKLTDAQLVARVRAFFGSDSRTGPA